MSRPRGSVPCHRYKWLAPLAFAAGMLVQGPAPAAEAEEVQRYRDTYQAAMRAVKARRYAEYHRLLRELDGYILKGYVEYEYLKNRIPLTPRAKLHDFIETNAFAPTSARLRRKWLLYLVRERDWDTFMAEYKNPRNDPRLACYRLDRLIRTSEDQAPLMEEVKQLWLTGRRLPSACNPVFAAWRKAGHMSSELVWQRIQLAMERGRVSLMRSLKRYLPRKERIWVRRWEDMHWNPNRWLNDVRYPVETPIARAIIKHGVVRVAYRDPEAAMIHWIRLKDKYQFFGEDENYILRKVGILAARNNMPQAHRWLAAVSADADDTVLHTWRIKTALRAGEWEMAKQFLASLPQEAQLDPQWRYWRARVLMELGHWDEAEPLFQALARERNYYGFLAADRVSEPYSMQHRSIEATPEEVTAMLARPGVRAAREFYSMGQTLQARRQWNWITQRMNNRELQVAALIAQEWGWHDRALYTVNKSQHRDDLDLRFPVLYREVVEQNAERTGIDPGWMYGVMRQESAFVVDARSGAGALGLMQLMPSTGRQMSRRLKLRIRSNRALLKVENNILLGASYLKRVLDRNDGSEVLATASYNAGPHRVKRWRQIDDPVAADIWVENIPFTETRNYVKNVLGYTAVYEYRLGGEPTRLEDRMPLVIPH